ncbi:cupin domain-containing protein [Cupriavidus sp. WKF15]|uniref:cupin domain-containing protein n=1 Tax=Cupriavidus sp. WKF15 TaxID=3032282 RepID=UPI0023E2EA46|nr:cupin domain-containing protein [Cupriavidus sp. WKF15]WER47968.1 cupin domain-containing protein [Cupriavidus sp. WKF15]
MKHITHITEKLWIPHKIEGSEGFEFIFDILAGEYTDAYSVDIVRVAEGGYSPPHIDPDNHAFYILGGEAEIDIADVCHRATAGAVVRIPRGVVHAVRNAGQRDLVLLTIYDPPRVRKSQDGAVPPTDHVGAN